MRQLDDSTLWQVSEFERMFAQTGNSGFARLNASTTLSAPLNAELTRLERGHRETQVLDVVAACLRQGESALLLLRLKGLVWPLTLFPKAGLYHLSRPIVDALKSGNADLEVIGVEPAGIRPPGPLDPMPIDGSSHFRVLPPLLWALALHAPQVRLLDDIGGRAAYRIAAGFDAGDVAHSGALASALRRLRLEVASLQDIAGWPGMDTDRAARLLDAIYLQGGLMVLRTHAAARGDAGPFGAFGRLIGRRRP